MSRAPALVQTIRFGRRPLTSTLALHRRLGDVFRLPLLGRAPFVVTNHPDHVRSLFTAKPADAPSATSQSPLRPILGPNSVLTLIGDRHMRQRKLLLPPFHGDAIAQYADVVASAIDRQVDTWPVDEAFALAPRMSAVTLDVIMAGVFGIDHEPEPGSTEHRVREATRSLMQRTLHPAWPIVDVSNIGREEPNRLLARAMRELDASYRAIIRERQASGGAERVDVLSVLLCSRDEDGVALTEDELRDELVTLLLAGHETTANQLAWTFERLLRAPHAYAALREVARAGDDPDGYVDAVIHESMRVRPVIPIVVRSLQRPWRFGEYTLPAQTLAAVSIIGLHHREDVYPDPLRFLPERWLGVKPGTYTWVPFGGGIRRCLGASLAMVEQRIVLETIARRTDLAAPRQRAETAVQRNVTMIPKRGGEVVVRAKQ
ncbi:MAG: cytochrome P450 [Solirubrobacteraceae bacterium]